MSKFKLMICAVVLLLSANVFAAYTWTWETGTNPDLLNQFMLNPDFLNMSMDTITLANGLTIDNGTNGALHINEASDELILTFGSNAIAVSSGDILSMNFGTIIVKANEMIFNPVPDANATEGTVYYDSDNDNLYVSTTAGWVDLTATSTSVFDDIYNNSAAAVNLIITADGGPIVINNTDADNAFLLSITPTPSGASASGGISVVVGANSTEDALHISHAGSGKLIHAESFDVDSHGDVNAVGGAFTGAVAVTGIVTATGGVTLQNGGTITNATDTEIKFTETATALEDFSIDFAVDEIDLKSGSGVTTIGWGDLDTWTGLNVMTFDAEASTITLPANSANDDLTIAVSGSQDAHLTISSTGTSENALVISTTDGGINITNNGAAAGEDIDISSTAASVNIIASEGVDDAIVLNANTALGGVDIKSNADIDIWTIGAAGEDVNIFDTGGSVIITATEGAADAITLNASTALGGIDILSNADVDIWTQGASGEDVNVFNTGGSIIIAATEDIADAIFINATTGGIDITADGASASDLDLVCTNGSINLTAGESAVNSIVISSTIGGIDITAAGAASGEDIDLLATGSSINITATEGTADAIVLNASTAVGGIDIKSNAAIDIWTQGAAGEDVNVFNTGGSITITATEGITDAIVLNASTAAGGIDVLSNADVDIWTIGAAGEDVNIFNTGGSIIITATESAVDAIYLNALLGGIDINCTGTAGEDIDVTAFGSSINLKSTENIASAIYLEATAGGIDINCTGSAGEDIDITNAGGSINLTASEAIANSIYIQALGTVAGNAINLATTNGGIVLTAANADNGDMTLTIGDDLAINATGTAAISSSGWGITSAGVMTGIQQKTSTRYVKHLLADTTIADSNSGQVFYVAKAGAGAAANITVTLPTAVAGLTFTIIDANETAAADVTVRASSGDKIDTGDAAAGYIHVTDADNYACVTLMAIDDVDWVVLYERGTWAATP